MKWFDIGDLVIPRSFDESLDIAIKFNEENPGTIDLYTRYEEEEIYCLGKNSINSLPKLLTITNTTNYELFQELAFKETGMWLYNFMVTDEIELKNINPYIVKMI